MSATNASNVIAMFKMIAKHALPDEHKIHWTKMVGGWSLQTYLHHLALERPVHKVLQKLNANFGSYHHSIGSQI